MADKDVAAAFRHDQRRRADQTILRQWREAGHKPYGHLAHVDGRGAGDVLNDFYHRECAAGMQTLGVWLGKEDMVEIGRAIQRKARDL